MISKRMWTRSSKRR
jgi:hypothetical protein